MKIINHQTVVTRLELKSTVVKWVLFRITTDPTPRMFTRSAHHVGTLFLVIALAVFSFPTGALRVVVDAIAQHMLAAL